MIIGRSARTRSSVAALTPVVVAAELVDDEDSRKTSYSVRRSEDCWELRHQHRDCYRTGRARSSHCSHPLGGTDSSLPGTASEQLVHSCRDHPAGEELMEQ